MKDAIKLLLSLQDKDLDVDRLKAELASIPGKITGLKSDIQSAKKALEDAKSELTHLQLAKKQKELDLDAQESAVRKHSNELNSVKTNEAYRALVGEIEKAKQDKSALEDQILQNMEQTDQATRVWKEKESGSKSHEAGLINRISELENKAKEIEQTLAVKATEREQALAALPNNLSDQDNKLSCESCSRIVYLEEVPAA